MKILINALGLFLIYIISTTFIYPQEIEESINIHPLIGNTLDRVEEEYFEIFPSIKNFQYAKFHLNSDSTLRANVFYNLDATLKDTILYRCNVLTFRNQIDQKLLTEMNVNEDLDNGEYVRIINLSNVESTGELLAIREKSLLILNMDEDTYFNNNNSSFNVSSIKFGGLNKVISFDKTNLAKYIYPLSLAVIAGSIYGGIAKSDGGKPLTKESVDKFFEDLGIIALLAGLSGGLGIMLSNLIPIWNTSEVEYTTPFDENDIEGLSESARYKGEEPIYIQFIE